MQVWISKVQNGKMCTGGKYKYGILKYSYARMEKASTENSSTGEQGWKMQVRKKPLLHRLLQYIQKSWLLKSTIGPQRCSVNGMQSSANK